MGLGDKLWFSLGGTVDSLRWQQGSKDLKEVRMPGGRIHQAKGMASAKALRRVCDWHV